VNQVNQLAGTSTAELLKQKSSSGSGVEQGSGDFAKSLQNALEDVNEIQQEGDEAMADLATGQVKDLHQAAIAIGKAELNMKLTLEIRNKALNAYKELSRIQM
jgi:flagellar hook-basal body complex protein FliE